jgi:meso-butanediol dehydrogenase / (S,S)-butanediol dehydrogenase / diacetyl reductase
VEVVSVAEGDGPPRVALVTGAGDKKGIGYAIAHRLTEDGFDVAVNDVEGRSEELQEIARDLSRADRRTLAVAADVSDPGDVDAMVGRVADELGRLNVMVANAGVSQPVSILDTTPEDWDRVMAVNARGVFLCYQAAARQMISQGSGGKIIGAASVVAYRSFPMFAHYSASKWAVRGLTQAAAQEWAEHGITVNAYCPGIVETALWERLDKELGEAQGLEKGEALAAAVDNIVLGRASTPEDVSNFVSYLASSDSDYMTGQSVLIDGGVAFS